MTISALKQRVEERDRLLQQAEQVGQQLNAQVLLALARGELSAAEAAARSHDAQLHELTENLRIYQAELHAQADELAASQAQTDALLSRFSTLFSSMPVAALLVAANGEVLEYNAVAERLLGLRGQFTVTRFLHRLVNSDTFQSLVRPAFLEAQNSGHSVAENVHFLGEAGRPFVGELHISRLRQEQAADGAFACAVVDRTEHIENLRALQAALEAQRRSEAFLSDTGHLARTGGWELTLHPRELRWSAHLRDVMGLGIHEPATLETLLAQCAPYDRWALSSAMAAAEQGAPFEIEVDMRGPAGRMLRVLATGRAEMTNGEVLRVHGVLQDISTQHLVRQQIGDLTDRLAIANEAGGIGVWDCDLLHDSMVVDARLGELLGLPRPLPNSGTLAEVFAPALVPEDAVALRQALDTTIAELTPLNLELRLAAPMPAQMPAQTPAASAGASPDSAATRWIHLSGRAHADGSGRAVRLVGCAWESSLQHQALEMKAARDAADGASRAKTAFLWRMSHELRTPLNAILGFSQLMRMEAEHGDLVLKPNRVTLIESAARHLLDLVNEVMDVTRIEAGQMDIRLVRCDLRSIVNESLPMVQGQAAALRVTLANTLAAGPPVWVHGDRLRLKELLINLLSNAVKFNHDGGRVDISAHTVPDGIELRVDDTGRGLDAKQLQKLFQPFNRLGAESLGIEGSGMGLFVCHRFVELMGGELRVTSQPGVGTTVVARLNAPAADEPSSQARLFQKPAANPTPNVNPRGTP